MNTGTSRLPVPASKANVDLSKSAPLKHKIEEEPVERDVRRKPEPASAPVKAAPVKAAPAKSAPTKSVSKPAATAAAKKPVVTSMSKTAPKAVAEAPKKRPAWDYKGRLEDMEKLATFMKEKVSTDESQSTQLAVSAMVYHISRLCPF